MNEPLYHFGKKTSTDARALNQFIQLHFVAWRQSGEFYHDANCIIRCASNLHKVLDFLSPIIRLSESTTLLSAVTRSMLPCDHVTPAITLASPSSYPNLRPLFPL